MFLFSLGEGKKKENKRVQRICRGKRKVLVLLKLRYVDLALPNTDLSF